jgi:hypothetical protein
MAKNTFRSALLLLMFCFSLEIHALFHRPEEFVQDVAIYACRTVAYPCDDANLVKRIIHAYQLAEKKHLGNSMWQMFYDQRFYAIHDVFQAGDFDLATDILRNPAQNELFYGIDNLAYSLLPGQLTYQGLVATATVSLDSLVRFGEAIGAIKLDNPEGHNAKNFNKRYANKIVPSLELKLGTPISFPNIYTDEVGIWTERGVASYRAIQALYQAHRIKELLKDLPNPRVLEIGAGLGRTAYYCKLLGIEDYTIIDIPMTALASSYFLGRTLGENQVCLLGENLNDSAHKVKILTPDQFLNSQCHYDLIVNVDSLTEMDINTIRAYLNKIEKSSSMFLSINHEGNSYSVFELLAPSSYVKTLSRQPYWMRSGYVEELYSFDKQR